MTATWVLYNKELRALERAVRLKGYASGPTDRACAPIAYFDAEGVYRRRPFYIRDAVALVEREMEV